jgi:PAS domain-containing protein
MSERAAPRQHHIALILARDLAATLATPIFVVDERGDLVYYNEAAEGVLGRPYAEVQMSADEWATAFRPVDEDGRPLPLEELPLGIAFLRGRPAHRTLTIEAEDGVRRDIEVTAFPLFDRPGEPVGGVAIFWEREEGS